MTLNSNMRRLLRALIVSNAISLLLFGLRMIGTQTTDYWFLFWNLFLAWMPVLFAWLLVRALRTRAWSEPLPVVLSLLWLGFLPNSFYLMSDLIHLRSTGDIGILYDAVFMLSFIWNGLVAGLLSMVVVHRQLNKRRHQSVATLLMIMVILLTSFAIYLGRNLRWNTWDVLVNPAGLLFDVSEQVVNPFDHPQSFATTATFFLLIGSMYYVVWAAYNVLIAPPNHKNKVK